MKGSCQSLYEVVAQAKNAKTEKAGTGTRNQHTMSFLDDKNTVTARPLLRFRLRKWETLAGNQALLRPCLRMYR